MPHNHGTESNNGLQRTSRFVFFGFVLVAAFYLLAEHRAHVIPFLPFLLLAACPLMHIFMHRGTVMAAVTTRSTTMNARTDRAVAADISTDEASSP